MSRHAFTLNGQAREVEAPDDMPLLWVLRDLVGLTGAKYGCGEGGCGACTVLLDGAAVPSCQLDVAQIRGRAITTIEGLSADGSHPLQRAWISEDVPQCGYCQAGQIMGAAALLAAHPKPTDAQIDTAMASHVCRCGTYVRIRAAIHRAAEEARS
jgi:isoquinoline 1-oxidoreductase alpha subunit